MIWQDTLNQLKHQMTGATFETWLRQSTAIEENDTLTVAVSTNRAKEILDYRLRPMIEKAIYNVAGHSIELIFVVDRSKSIPSNNRCPSPPIQEENVFDLFNASKILATNWPEPAWVVPGALPEGLIILAGKPKLGKSWLALQLAQAVSTGGIFLNAEIDTGRVLYLALEDPPRRLKERMNKQRWVETAQADFMVLGSFDNQIGDLGNGGGEILAQQIRLRKYRLVIIDTFSRSISGDQKDHEIMTAAMDPLQEIAHSHHCAVMMIDHHTKAKNLDMDVITDIFGSVAKGAMVDTAWGFYRDPGMQGAVLAVTGREVVEQKFRLSMNWETGLWLTEGSSLDAIKLTARRQEILDVLQVLEHATAGEVAIAINQDRSNTYRRLQDLVNAGFITRTTEHEQVIFRASPVDNLST